MTYPLSTDVTSGQPTAAVQYNNLRADALTLGNAPADSLDFRSFFARHFEHMDLQYLATNRLRVPYSPTTPPTLMINGYMLQLKTNADLPSGSFSGSAATWYVFAVRTPGSTTFTIAVNSSATEAPDQRLIGECYWDGTNLIWSRCYLAFVTGIPVADYDSGWFAVAGGNAYIKAHGLGQCPRIVQLYWCSAADGSSEQFPVYVVKDTITGGDLSVLGFDVSNAYINTGTGTSSFGTLFSKAVQSSSGFYRILAWK